MGAKLCAADVGPTLASFKLYVERANDLKKADLLGHSDPYVVARFLDMRPALKQSRRVEKKYPEMKRLRQQTRVIQDQPNPVWKEIFVMNDVPAEFVLLRLEVFDKDTIGRDTFLGRVDTQLGYWDRKTKRWRSRFGDGNVDIPEGERLFFPVVRKDAVLRTRVRSPRSIVSRRRDNASSSLTLDSLLPQKQKTPLSRKKLTRPLRMPTLPAKQMKANGKPESEVTGTLTFRLTRERDLEGRLMN